MKAELNDHLTNIDIILIKGGGGIFEVIVDGKMIFNKKVIGRFPNDGEIAALLL